MGPQKPPRSSLSSADAAPVEAALRHVDMAAAPPAEVAARQRGWQRHMPQPIVVKFMPPRAATVVAQPVNAARVAGPTAGSAACTAVLPATDVVDAAALRDAADACAARQVDTSVEAMSLAADEGRVTGQAAIERSWLVGQMARLVAMLPMVSLIKCCAARSSAELVAMGYERIAHHLIERAPKPWKWSTVKDACNNWARWLLWLDRHAVEHDGVPLHRRRPRRLLRGGRRRGSGQRAGQ